MTACKSYVHVWNVVNEPMDDTNPTQLKTGKNIEKQADDEFYWQDYLGKDYAVKAFTYARKYANSGDKLFINENGLEATGTARNSTDCSTISSMWIVRVSPSMVSVRKCTWK